MDLKSFFLNEMAIDEMAGMPKDNAYNGGMYKRLMDKYGSTYEPGYGGAWPKGVSFNQRAEDVSEWHAGLAEEGIYPSRPPTPRTLVAALDWPFKVGSGLRSKNAAQNMRALAVEVGFATQEQMDELAQAEERKDVGLAPKMSQVVKTDPKAQLGGPVQPPPGKSGPPPLPKRGGEEEDDFDYTKWNEPYAGESVKR